MAGHLQLEKSQSNKIEDIQRSKGITFLCNKSALWFSYINWDLDADTEGFSTIEPSSVQYISKIATDKITLNIIKLNRLVSEKSMF